MKKIITSILLFYSFLIADLIQPFNDEALNSIYVLFEWNQEPSAINYNLQASNQDTFENIFLDIVHPTTVYIEKNSFTWNETFYWRVRPIYDDGNYGNWIGSSQFSINEPTLQNLETTIYNDDLIQDGLIIYGEFSPNLLIGVIDKFGNEIWNGGNPDNDHQLGVFLNYVSNSGQLFGKSHQSGIKFNYKSEVLWDTPNDTVVDLHEIQQLPNGNYMSFVPVYELGPIAEGPWTHFFQNLGYIADGETNEFPWLGLKLVEWDKDTKEEVWTWNPFNHFTMNDHDLYGNLWWDAYINGRFDWLHSNSFSFDIEESVIYVSHRHLSRISKTAYPSGEILWNIGLPSEYNTGNDNICTDLLFSWQHHVQLIDNGDLLFFDNGNLSDMLLGDTSKTSRVRRIKVNDDNTCETIWQYDLPENLYGPGTGSVQLLDNGNYLIYTLGQYIDCSILEVNSEKELLWQTEAEDSTSTFYRAYKIPSIYPETFSLIADNYKQIDNNGEILNIIDFSDSINFIINNESGYNHSYKYTFKNPNGNWFEDVDGQININAYQSGYISFIPFQTDESNTDITLDMWPIDHEYAKKELEFLVSQNDLLIGDLNEDYILNIEDIILMINMSLDIIENDLNGDMNGDGGLNILDIIVLLNIIILN